MLDVTEPLLVEVDQIYHLACPASPIFYKYNPVKVLEFEELFGRSSCCILICKPDVLTFNSWCLDNKDKCHWHIEYVGTCQESWSKVRTMTFMAWD